MTDKTIILATLRDALDEQDRRITAARGQQIKAEGQLERVDTILAGGQIDQCSGERERKLLNLVAYYHRTAKLSAGESSIADRYESLATRQALKERDEALARVANEPIMLAEYRRQIDTIREAYAKVTGPGATSSKAIAEYIMATSPADIDEATRKMQATVREAHRLNLAELRALLPYHEAADSAQVLRGAIDAIEACVRERDTARVERDAAMKRVFAAESQFAEMRGRIVEIEDDIKHIVSAYHDVGGANPATAAAVAEKLREPGSRARGGVVPER